MIVSVFASCSSLDSSSANYQYRHYYVNNKTKQNDLHMFKVANLKIKWNEKKNYDNDDDTPFPEIF